MTVVNLREASNISSFGGKASALAQLLSDGFLVPDGYVIGGEVNVDSHIKDILSNFDALSVSYVAVRSSAVAEDGNTTSWAGQMETFLNVNRDDLIEAIKTCQQSSRSARAMAYAKQNNMGSGQVAVIVQAMIESEASGVAFSVHPVTQSREELVIEAVLGLGEALVSGNVTPDTYIVSKPDTDILAAHVGNQTRLLGRGANGKTNWQDTNGNMQKLTNIQVTELSKQVVRLEQYFGYPVDVEWALYKEQFYILQSRPITTLV